MRIVLANKHFLGLAGGAERNIADLANWLARRGHDVFIVSETKHGQASAFPLDTHVHVVIPTDDVRGKVDHVAMEYWDDPDRLGWANQSFSMRSKWGFTVRRLQPDVILTFLPHTSTMLLQELRDEFPIIVTNQSDPAVDYFSDKHSADPTEKALRLHSLGYAAAVHFLLPEFVQKMPAWVQTKSIVVPNAAPIGRYRRDDVLRNRVIAVGRLEPNKGFALLIDAFAHVARSHPDWQLHLFGRGPEDQTLRTRIRRHRLQRNVIMRGFASEPVAEMAKSDIFVIPSVYEGWGLTLTEAMSVGLASIGFADCSGVNTLIHDDANGVLVAQRSAEDLAEAINNLITDEPRRARLGREALIYVSQYSADAIYGQWEAEIAKFAGSARHARDHHRDSSLQRTEDA